MLYPCIFCIALCVVCVACLTLFVNSLVKQFAMSLGLVVILLLNVMEVLRSVGGCALFNIPYNYGLPKNVCVVPVIPVCI